MNIEFLNLGTINKNKVTINSGLVLYFSYETLIGFWELNKGTTTIKNYWSKTTGKFLNELEPNKSKRLNKEEFKKKLEKAFKGLLNDTN